MGCLHVHTGVTYRYAHTRGPTSHVTLTAYRYAALCVRYLVCGTFRVFTRAYRYVTPVCTFKHPQKMCSWTVLCNK